MTLGTILLIILYVALEMIWEGSHDFFGEPAAALLGGVLSTA